MILRILGLFLFFVMLLGVARMILDKLTFSLSSLISSLLFAAIGFAIGSHYSERWAMFGAIFGGLIGIEYKDNLFKFLHLLYRDIVEERI